MNEMNALLVTRALGSRWSYLSRSGPTIALGAIFSLVFCASVAQPLSVDANNAEVVQRVKAASIYKFLNYVEWPATSFSGADSPYVIGVIGADAIESDLLKIVADRNLNNRTLSIKKLNAGDPLTGVHVLFIGQSGKSAQAQLLKQAQQLSILTVTESNGALAEGSMINFVIAGDRVRFEVALDTARKADLKLSARMLSVALSVSKGEP